MLRSYNQLSDILWCFPFPFYLHSPWFSKIIKPWHNLKSQGIKKQECKQQRSCVHKDELKVKAFGQSRIIGYFLIMYSKTKFLQAIRKSLPNMMHLDHYSFYCHGQQLYNLTHTVIPLHPCAAFLHSNQPGTVSHFVPLQC